LQENALKILHHNSQEDFMLVGVVNDLKRNLEKS
jgi:hypothetical protein